MQAFVDFDGVLFNIRAAKIAYEGVFGSFGIAPALFRETYAEMKGQLGRDEPAFHAQLLRKYVSGLNVAALLRALTDFKVERSAEFVYRDAPVFLRFLGDAGFDVHLVTTGSASLQPKKVAASGLGSFFQSVRVLDSDLKGMAVKMMYDGGGRSVFIDDKHTAIEDVKRAVPDIVAVQVVRQREIARSPAADFVAPTLGRTRDYVRKFFSHKL